MRCITSQSRITTWALLGSMLAASCVANIGDPGEDGNGRGSGGSAGGGGQAGSPDDEPRSPSNATRRLSNQELAHTFEQVLGFVPTALAVAPLDQRDYTFDRVADSQTVSPVHVEAFRSVAEGAARELLQSSTLVERVPSCIPEILPAASPSTTQTFNALALTRGPDWAVCEAPGVNADHCGQPIENGFYFLYSPDAFVSLQHEFPSTGSYDITLRVGTPHATDVHFALDGERVATGSVPGSENRDLQAATVTVEVTEGAHPLEITFEGTGWSNTRFDVASLTIEGPIDPAANAATERRQCAQDFIAYAAPLAFRRPLKDGEADRLLGLYDAGLEEGGSFHDAWRMVNEAIFRSPYFLYLVLLGSPTETDGVHELNAWELASRLSYSLCEAPPDAELRAAAADDSLLQDDVLRAQATRLLRGPCGRTATLRFYEQWLWLDQLEGLARDPDIYPSFDAQSTPQAMARETSTYLEQVTFEENANVEELYTASYSYLDSESAPLYGLSSSESEPTRTPLPPERSGLLTQPAILSVTAKFDQTSPVRRGIFVLDQLLCDRPPSPPGTVDITPPEWDPTKTTRERWAAHSSVPGCAECHTQLDPVGFAFENFDAIGQHRSEENGLPIDSLGGLPALGYDDGSLQGGAAISTAVGESREAAVCLSRQAFRWVYGRLEDEELHQQSIETAADAMVGDGAILEGIIALVTSPSFKRRYLEQEQP